jgi:hypothetical protein
MTKGCTMCEHRLSTGDAYWMLELQHPTRLEVVTGSMCDQCYVDYGHDVFGKNLISKEKKTLE